MAVVSSHFGVDPQHFVCGLKGGDVEKINIRGVEHSAGLADAV